MFNGNEYHKISKEQHDGSNEDIKQEFGIGNRPDLTVEDDLKQTEEVDTESNVEEVVPVKKVTKCEALNFRSEPGFAKPKLKLLKRNTKVKVLETDENWSKVELEDGSIGWVHSAYLKDSE